MPNQQIVDLIRDEFTAMNRRLDQQYEEFSKHMEKDEKAWEKLDKVVSDERTLRNLLHTIWIGATTVIGFVIAWRWK